MSVLGIASTALSQLGNIQSKFQQVQGEFKTLGQDLSAGNLAQAQTDFVTLSQSVTSQLTSNSPFAKAINAVGQALQSGDLHGSAAGICVHPVHDGRAYCRPPSSAHAAIANLGYVCAGTEYAGPGAAVGEFVGGATGVFRDATGLAADADAGHTATPAVSSGVNVTV